MNKIFIKVPFAERYPEKSGVIIVLHSEGYPILTQYEVGHKFNSTIEYWLEEVEITINETNLDKIEKAAKKSYSHAHRNIEEISYRLGFELGAEWALENIKTLVP